MPGIHRLVHEGVSTGKMQHLVGEVLGGAVLLPGLVGGLAGTLRGQEGTSSAWPPQHPSLLPAPSPRRAGLGPSPHSSLGSIFSTPLPDLGPQLSRGGSHRDPIPAGDKMEDWPHLPPPHKE